MLAPPIGPIVVCRHDLNELYFEYAHEKQQGHNRHGCALAAIGIG